MLHEIGDNLLQLLALQQLVPIRVVQIEQLVQNLQALLRDAGPCRPEVAVHQVELLEEGYGLWAPWHLATRRDAWRRARCNGVRINEGLPLALLRLCKLLREPLFLELGLGGCASLEAAREARVLCHVGPTRQVDEHLRQSADVRDP